MKPLPSFSLTDAQGHLCTFPSSRPALLCFIREDCPTCNLVMPLIEAMHRAFGAAMNVWCIGQEGNATLIERHHLTVPMLDDTALRVSFKYDVETVPTVILADANGNELRRMIGYRKEEWQSLIFYVQSLVSIDDAQKTKDERLKIDWLAYPDYRPGCGSKSVEPGITERLQAEAEGSPLRARRIEIAPADDEFEFMFDQGLTDGLPVVPPTPERVLRMLRGTKRDAQSVVAVVPP